VCGIFGCLCDGATVAILEGLKRLEYRGYDSVGVAVIQNNGIRLEKDKGKIAEFINSLDLSRLSGDIGVGHTRWATHGAPCRENAHPHLDCSKTIAVAHNGVLENFIPLKEDLLKRGHRFLSNTDTEVISHLIEDGIKSGLRLKEATVRAVQSLKGSFALAVISSSEPDKIICVKKESPLVIGISGSGSGNCNCSGTYCASDTTALLPFTRRVLVMQDDEVAVLTRGGVTLEDIWGRPKDPSYVEITWDSKMSEKGGYPHFMLKEMFEQPAAIRETLKISTHFLDRASELMKGEVYLTGSGTSYHACLTASYLFSKLLGMNVRAVISSEFQDAVNNLKGSTVVGVSQSGETADTLNALKYARSQGATIVGITNTLGSSITTLSSTYICTQSGPEIGVAATKTLLTQLVALEMLMLRTGLRRGILSEEAYSLKREQLAGVPDLVERILRGSKKIEEIALKHSLKRDAFFLARGLNVATALEGALKLKEISYIHAEGYPAGESKHGPISLVEPGFLCVFAAPKDSARSRVIGNMMEMKARGAEIFSIITEGDEELQTISDDYFEVPEVPEFITPIVCTVPLQLFAYYVATFRGLDPDKPRNLAKSVTVL